MSKAANRGADFLPPRILEWARDPDNRALLRAVAREYADTSEWPSLPALQRRIVQEGQKHDFAAAASGMPHEVGFREFHPEDQVGLLLLGLYLSGQADTLLDHFAAFMRLAAARYAETGNAAPTVRRADLVSELGLSEHDARALSRLILREAPFLGGGSAEPDRWERTVSEQIVPFLESQDIETYLRVRADQLQLNRQPTGTSDESRHGFGRLSRGAQLAAGALAAVGTVYSGIKGLPSPVIGVAVGVALAGFIGATVGFRQRTRRLLALVVLVPVLAGVLAGFAAEALREDPVSEDEQRREKTLRAARRILLNELGNAIASMESARGHRSAFSILPLKTDAWRTYGTFLAEELPGAVWQKAADYYTLAEAANENPQGFAAGEAAPATKLRVLTEAATEAYHALEQLPE
jgi:hypothetical protein